MRHIYGGGLLVLALVLRIAASPADAIYYLQGATETIRVTRITRTGEEILSNTSRQLDPTLSGVRILHPDIPYKAIKSFKGELDGPAKNAVNFWQRPPGASSVFGNVVRNDLFTQMFDTTCSSCPNGVILSGSGFDWYFPFSPDTLDGSVRINTSEYVIGRRGPSDKFATWFGAVVAYRVRLLPSGLTGREPAGGLYVFHYDSAHIDSAMMSLPRGLTYTDSISGLDTLQLLKFRYDTTEAAVSQFPRIAAKSAARVGLGSADIRGVYDPSGRLVARGSRVAALEARPLAAGVYLLRVRGDVRTRRVTAVSGQ